MYDIPYIWNIKRSDTNELTYKTERLTDLENKFTVPCTHCCCCCCLFVVSDSVRPHRRQPARLPRPWDSPGKNTGVGCHFLLQCMKVKSESEVAQSCLTLRDPMDCSPPGSSVHGIFQARALEWVPLPSPPALAVGFFTTVSPRKPLSFFN